MHWLVAIAIWLIFFLFALALSKGSKEADDEIERIRKIPVDPEGPAGE